MPTRSPTRSELAEESAKIRGQNALMYATYTELGSVVVNCPYCLVNDHVENKVDVTKFIDNDGKREHTTSCSKGHTLRFTSIDEWRERRILAGLQQG